MSHQLTPFMLIAALAGLAVAGVLRTMLLPLVLATVTLAWISYGADAFWTGHLGTILGDAGQVNAVVGSGVSERMAGSPVHQHVVHARMAFTAAAWLLAGAGGLALLRRQRRGLTIGLLAVVPFSMIAVQSYGGEGLLRVFLFSLPGTSLLAADLAVWAVRRGRLGAVSAWVCAAAMVPAFLVTRYGNESFERVTTEERRGVERLYQLAPPGSTLVSPTAILPWRYARFDGYDYQPFGTDEEALRDVDRILGLMADNPRGGYLIITAGQIAYGVEAHGLPPTWGSALEAKLDRNPRVKRVFRDRDSVVYRYVRPRS